MFLHPAGLLPIHTHTANCQDIYMEGMGEQPAQESTVASSTDEMYHQRATASERPCMDAAEGPFGSILSKLSKLVLEENYERNMTTGMKEELSSKLKSLAHVLRYLQALHCKRMDAPVTKPSIGYCQVVRTQLYKAENFVDYVMAAAECSGHEADPGGFRRLFKTTRDSPNPLHQLSDTGFISDTFVLAYATARDRIKPDIDEDNEGIEIEPVGIDGPRDEIELLIKMVAAGDNPDYTRSVSIVGIGGLGKTTLAQVVYHHLKPQFHCGAFVTVPLDSTDEKLNGFFMEMLRQLDVENHMNIDHKAMKEGELISRIKEFLQDKRYLVVIDDLWRKDDLDTIVSSLAFNSYGSRVITTTRYNETVEFCGPYFGGVRYEIRPLGYKDSRELFLKRMFYGEVSRPDAPMDVFHEIIKMCGGTPSAIRCIASRLAYAAARWQEVINPVHSAWKQMASHLYSGSENIPGYELLISIVSRAYSHLPSSLKACLLCLTMTAKNQIVHRSTMIRKWIAEGFISQCGRCSREEIASLYFDELIDRNFIRLLEYGNYLGEEIYEVNYMIFSVLRRITDRDGYNLCTNNEEYSCKYAHTFCFQGSGSDVSVQTEVMNGSLIRSITILGPAKFFLNDDLVYMRVLDLDGCRNLNNPAMDHICRMFLLKYLSLKHTQVTEIPTEIGELRYLETLDIRQTEISNLPPEIGRLQKLETLDARQTQVKELPKEVVQLPKLAYLYFGQCSAPGGVMLYVGLMLKSVKVFGTVDSRGWSESALEEIIELTGVTELEVVLHDQPADKDKNDKLLSAIGRCVNLEYLIIHGDYNPSDELPVSTSFTLLERLKVAGRFIKVPRWFAQLSNLKKLLVRVCKLDQDDLKILGGLPGLTTLALALVCIPRKKEVAITNGLPSSHSSDLHPGEETSPAGFMSLEVFNFDCRVPWITFEQGAMPRLKQLHLKLYASSVDKSPSGIINLRSLEKIILRCSSQDAISSSVIKVVDAVREEASSHGNRVELSVNGEDEVFQSRTRVDETITATEIEE